MDGPQRLSELVDVLRRDGRVDVAAAAAEFGTAQLTIRRDLDVLVARGVARRTRGGAVNLLMLGEELPFAMREIEAVDSKRRIAVRLAFRRPHFRFGAWHRPQGHLRAVVRGRDGRR